MKASAVFKLHDFLYLQGGAHPFVLDDRIPLSEQILCPADGKTLKTLCTFVGENGTRRMRYGCCDVCGYQGYIDRPTKAWISHFYFEMWEKDEGALIPDNEIKKLGQYVPK